MTLGKILFVSLNDMFLGHLRVIHWLKSSLRTEALEERAWEGAEFVPGALYLNSCQRVLFVCTADQLEQQSPSVLRNARIFENAAAYCLLLKVATGLESQVVGETDILGQLKEAWRRSRIQPAGLDPEVDFWIQKIFEDAKEIRSLHLERLGGLSYGSLVRLFLRKKENAEATARPEGPVLLIGAGQLAQAVAPYLADVEGARILLWNRSRERAISLQADLRARGKMEVEVLESEEQERMAWCQASRVILCIPVDEADRDEDERRIRLWREGFGDGSRKNRVLLHLGAQANEAGPWKGVEQASFLDELFALQGSRGEARSLQVRQALRACDERAKLRALGSSVSIPHGWEDLAVFA